MAAAGKKTAAATAAPKGKKAGGSSTTKRAAKVKAVKAVSSAKKGPKAAVASSKPKSNTIASTVFRGDGFTLTGPTIKREPETWHLHKELTGPFMDVAMKSWQAFYTDVNAEVEKITGVPHRRCAGCKLGKTESDNRYRAGVAYDDKKALKAVDLKTTGAKISRALGGKFASFLLVGGWEKLPEAWGHAMAAVEAHHLKPRQGSYHYEFYRTAMDVPQEKQETMIYIAV